MPIILVLSSILLFIGIVFIVIGCFLDNNNSLFSGIVAAFVSGFFGFGLLGNCFVVEREIIPLEIFHQVPLEGATVIQTNNLYWTCKEPLEIKFLREGKIPKLYVKYNSYKSSTGSYLKFE